MIFNWCASTAVCKVCHCIAVFTVDGGRWSFLFPINMFEWMGENVCSRIQVHTILSPLDTRNSLVFYVGPLLVGLDICIHVCLPKIYFYVHDYNSDRKLPSADFLLCFSTLAHSACQQSSYFFHVCVCVWEREREGGRKGERECVSLCVWRRGGGGGLILCPAHLQHLSATWSRSW